MDLFFFFGNYMFILYINFLKDMGLLNILCVCVVLYYILIVEMVFILKYGYLVYFR